MKFRILFLILLLLMTLCACSNNTAPQTTESRPSSTIFSPTKPPGWFYDDTYPTIPDPHINEIIHFNKYEDVARFLSEENKTGAQGLAKSPPIRSFLERIEETGLWVPYCGGKPILLAHNETENRAFLSTSDWFRRPWIYYRTRTENDDFLLVRITLLEPELEALAQESTVLELLRRIHPKIYESNTQKGGLEVCERKVVTAYGEQMAYLTWDKDDEEHINIIQGPWLISLRTKKGVMTDEWLKGFELRPLDYSDQL